MAKLKRDERVCPFCAEHIKAAATRCRYCHSTVTPVTQTPEAQTPEVQTPKVQTPKTQTPKTPPPPPPAPPRPKAEAETEPAAGPAAEDADAVTGPATPPLRQLPVQEWQATVRAWLVPGQRSLTIVLATLVLLAGAGVGVSWWRADHGSSAVAPNGALVGDDARTQVLVSAADLTQRTVSYNYTSLKADMRSAHAHMTPSFRKEYDATMAQVRDNTIKNKIVLEAVVVSSAIIKATEHDAKVLVFLNQTTSAGTGKDKKQQLNRNSLVITLKRGDGDWAMSKVTALG
jgi:Mce-associated membrane protein